MKGWFVTFGTNHNPGGGGSGMGKYFEVGIADADTARAVTEAIFGTDWSMIYPMGDLDRQVSAYGLTCIGKATVDFD